MLHSQEEQMNRLTIATLRHIVSTTKDESLKMIASIELNRREALISKIKGA